MNTNFDEQKWHFDNYDFTEVPLIVKTTTNLKWPPKVDELHLDTSDPRFDIPIDTEVVVFDHLRRDQFRFRSIDSKRVGYANIEAFQDFESI